MTFYAIGYQKTDRDGQKISVSTNLCKAKKTYEKFRGKKYFRVCLLEYSGKSAADYILLAQSENGEEVSTLCPLIE